MYPSILQSGTLNNHGLLMPLLASHQLMLLTFQLCLAREFQIDYREPAEFVQRLAWEEFFATHAQGRYFRRHLRMGLESFNILLDELGDSIRVDNMKSRGQGGAIIPEIRLFCTLRWMAGALYTDLFIYTGISCSSFYRVIWHTIGAILQVDCLRIKFPRTERECREAAAGFEDISFGGAIINCVSVIDGFLCEIKTPSRSDVGNVRSFFSGHYQRYGVNIQAACDANCCFTYFAIVGPGSMGDRAALSHCSLSRLIDELPGLYCVIGDNAYKPSEHCCPIYGNVDCLCESYDTYNFFASQLRIRIEMSFGMMLQKWGILAKPLRIKPKNIKLLLNAIARLHNFCIKERLRERQPAVARNMNYDQALGREAQIDRAQAANFEQFINDNDGYSMNRERMVNRIYTTLGFQRPYGNCCKGFRGRIARRGTTGGGHWVAIAKETRHKSGYKRVESKEGLVAAVMRNRRPLKDSSMWCHPSYSSFKLRNKLT